jgi:hypothetical protein
MEFQNWSVHKGEKDNYLSLHEKLECCSCFCFWRGKRREKGLNDFSFAEAMREKFGLVCM